MPSSGSFLRQLSGRSTSWRWGAGTSKYCTAEGGYNCERSLKQMEGLDMYGNENAGLVMRKRVVVVVDQTSHSKHAMMWALTHVANKGDLLTLLHIIPPGDRCSGERPSDSHSPYLASSLGSLCKASRPEKCTDGCGGSGSAGDSRTQAEHGDKPSEEARGFCARPGSEKALHTYQLPLWDKQQRRFCSAVHQQRRVLDCRCKEAEQRHERVPHHHSNAERFLAPGIVSSHKLITLVSLFSPRDLFQRVDTRNASKLWVVETYLEAQNERAIQAHSTRKPPAVKACNLMANN
ncbi:hypothetical protein DKX38_008091 [Salix brachista]|uniref:UspA domain-containing protein n=1 Tax=Salix brachista TaxID=2182728 RepID=A0A5N5MQA2_9ROSI|nr:hypothetical protein DKX38_008091 [Salix brachista]